jgi:hypothetical protein
MTGRGSYDFAAAEGRLEVRKALVTQQIWRDGHGDFWQRLAPKPHDRLPHRVLRFDAHDDAVAKRGTTSLREKNRGTAYDRRIDTDRRELGTEQTLMGFDGSEDGGETAQRAFAEFQERQFIELVTKGAFSRKSPHASERRLTLNTCDVTGELASKAFMRWGREKQNAVSKYPVAVSNQSQRAA